MCHPCWKTCEHIRGTSVAPFSWNTCWITRKLLKKENGFIIYIEGKIYIYLISKSHHYCFLENNVFLDHIRPYKIITDLWISQPIWPSLSNEYLSDLHLIRNCMTFDFHLLNQKIHNEAKMMQPCLSAKYTLIKLFFKESFLNNDTKITCISPPADIKCLNRFPENWMRQLVQPLRTASTAVISQLVS